MCFCASEMNKCMFIFGTLSVKTQQKSFFCDLLFYTKKTSFMW